MKLVLFCEAAADHRMAALLVDRVLCEEGPTWIADLMDSAPQHVREWTEDGLGRSYFDIHAVDKYMKQLGVRALQGHFGRNRGGPGAHMARNIFSIMRALNKGIPDEKTHEAVFIVWDMDGQGELRRKGLDQAREEAASWASFRIVFGCPDLEHETWLLAGFEPETDKERQCLEELRRELGLCPIRDAHDLNATADGAKKNPKRVVEQLMGADASRKERCLQQPLNKLRQFGERSGLREFLDEVNQHIWPLFLLSPRQT